jgi:hypothetical protein
MCKSDSFPRGGILSPKGCPHITDRNLFHYVTWGHTGALLPLMVWIDFARMHHPEYLINVELLIWWRKKYWTARYWSDLDWITICINPVAAFTCQLYCCNNLSFWFLISHRIKHIFLLSLFVSLIIMLAYLMRMREKQFMCNYLPSTDNQDKMISLDLLQEGNLTLVLWAFNWGWILKDL